MGDAGATIDVLGVTADPDLATDLRTHLGGSDAMRVTTAETVGEAVDHLAADGRVDCVVSDHALPDTDGVAFLEVVRARSPTLPFVLLTAETDVDAAARAERAGVTEYLPRGDDAAQWEAVVALVEKAVAADRTRAGLVDADRRTRAVLDAAPDPIAIVRDGRVRYLNEAGVTLAGVADAAAPLDTPAGDLVAVPTGPPLEERLAAVQAGETTLDAVEGEFTAHDGTVTPVEVTASRLVEAEGPAVVVVAHDVTERKASERDLALKERAMDEAPVGITIADAADPEYPVIYANEGFRRLTGYPTAEILGRNCRFLQGEATAESSVAEIRRALATETPVTVELRNYRRDGTEFWNRVTIAPVRDDAGEVTHYVGFQQDVTDRKTSERRMRRYERAVEASTDMIVAFDADRRYLFVNERYRDYYDLSDDGPPDARVDELLDEGTWAQLEPHVERALAGDAGRFQTTLPRPDRPDGTFDVRYFPLEDPATGAVDGVVATMRDVTERQEREQQLAVLDRVLRHNLRTALNVIVGNAEELAAATDGDLAAAAEAIREAGHELGELAETERDIVEVIADPSPVQSVDLAAVAADVADRCRERYPDADVTVRAPASAQATAIPEIRRAVAELLDNALAHAGREPPSAEVAVEAGAESVTVRVADDGPGLPADERAALAGAGDTDPLYHSSGLGLWLVNWVVTQSGGAVDVAANDPRGTVVTVTLPAASDDDGEAA